LIPRRLAARRKVHVRPEEKHLGKGWVEVNDRIAVPVRVLEEVRVRPEAVIPFASVLILDKRAVKQQVPARRITFFADGVNDLVGGVSECANGDGVSVMEPERYRCAKLPARSVKLCDFDGRSAHDPFTESSVPAFG
jgi:hypothetical protein